jgi:RecA/RadA recombinase
MKQPSYNPNGLSAIRQLLIKENKLRALDQQEKFPVISTGSQPLDWVTDCGGIPRGRIVVAGGPESSGKCVTLDTVIPVFGQGLLDFRDLAQDVSWKTTESGEVSADQHAPLLIRVPGANGEPVNTTDIYFAGTLPINKMVTEDGHELSGAREHRVLCLNLRGYIAYTMLRDLRVGNIIVKSIGHRVTGPQETIFGWGLPSDTREITLKEASTAALIGALSGAELRDGAYYILITHAHQMHLVRQWAQDVFDDPQSDPFDRSVLDFSRFSGLARICDGSWTELTQACIQDSPAIFRKVSLTAQAHWCAGLTLVRGAWTQYDLEFELQTPEVAKTLHLLLENIGIRSIIYPSLNTFGMEIMKVALRNRISQQMAEDFIWQGYHQPPDWKGYSIKEEEETHPYVKETLLRAQEVLIEEDHNDLAEQIDVEDLDKENLLAVAEILFPLSRRKRKVDRIYESLTLLGSPNIYLDRVTFSKALTLDEPLIDLRVPIGSHYAGNGIISHNSTLALHVAGQELQNNPKSVVVYQDFEHSMLVSYAARIIKKQYNDRFILMPADVFEETDKYLLKFFKAGVVPSLWIIDSVPAMVPSAMFGKFSQDEDDEEKVGVQIGLQAKMFSEALARWVKVAGSYGMTFLMLNQIRANIKINKFQKGGSGGRSMPGIPESGTESAPGGFALRFYNSMTLDLRPRTTIKAEVFNTMLGEKTTLPVATTVQINVKKNKCGAPHRSCLLYIQFGEGIDTIRTLFDLGISRGVIKNPAQGTFALQLPDGQFLSERGQENFINILKGKSSNGAMGIVAVDYLKRALQWDKADEIHSKILGLQEEDVESGEISEVEPVVGDVDPSLLEYVRTRMTFVEKADALNMIARRGKSVYWTNPETQEEFRAMSLSRLFEKLEEKDEEVFLRMVTDKIKYIESLVVPSQGPTPETTRVQVQPFPVATGPTPPGLTVTPAPEPPSEVTPFPFPMPEEALEVAPGFDVNAPGTWVPEEGNPEEGDSGAPDPLEGIWGGEGEESAPGLDEAPGVTQEVELGNGDEGWDGSLVEGFEN